MEEQGFSESEIEKKVKSFRKQLMEKSERERERQQVDLEYDENGKPLGDSHKQAEANDFKNKKLREAFGLGEYDPILKAKKLEEERAQRIEMAREMQKKNYQLVKEEEQKKEQDNKKHKKSSKKSKRHRNSSSTDTEQHKNKQTEIINKDKSANYLDRFEGRCYEDLDDIDKDSDNDTRYNNDRRQDSTRRHAGDADNKRKRDYQRNEELNKKNEIEMRKQLEDRIKDRQTKQVLESDSESESDLPNRKKRLASKIVGNINPVVVKKKSVSPRRRSPSTSSDSESSSSSSQSSNESSTSRSRSSSSNSDAERSKNKK
jgi:hypothetical protein